MRRTTQRPVKQALLASISVLLAGNTASAQPAASIRYGHEEGRASTSTPSRQMETASLSNYTSDRPFRYPDEAPGRYTAPIETAEYRENPPVSDGPHADLEDYTSRLPTVDPQHYETSVKVGDPYEIYGVTYTPHRDPFYDNVGTASWYGGKFHGRQTSNGEIFDQHGLTAAHPTLPLPCYVLVTNETSGKKVVVRVNDRGPFKKNRMIDLSRAAAEEIGMIETGTARVRVQYLGPAEKAGDRPFRDNSIVDDVQIADLIPPSPPPMRPTPQLEAISNQHFVQLGSFTDRQNADNYLGSVSGYSNQGSVVLARINGKPHFRVVLGPFASQDDADAMRLQMRQNGFDGIVIKNPSLT